MSEPTRRLVLLRHAKADPHGRDQDVLRALTARGRRQASGVGICLLQAHLEPEVVLCSPAVRTRQTAQLALGNMGNMPEVEIRYVDSLYHGFVSELVEEVQDLDERVRTVLVVGHEPTMSAVAATLADDDSPADLVAAVNRGVPTACYTVLQTTGPWTGLATRTARLTAVVPPRE